MFLRIFKYSAKNILRNKFLSLSSILVLGLLIFFINILVVLHNVSINLIADINSKLTVSLYLKDDLTENSFEITEFLKDLRHISAEMSVTFNSKEAVLEDLEKRDPELVKILERDNPLPPTISIEGVSLEDYEQMNDVISSRAVLLLGNEGTKDDIRVGTSSGTTTLDLGDGEKIDDDVMIPSENIYSYEAQYNRINKVILVLSSLKYGLYVIIAIFSLSIGVIVYSVIGNFVYYYRNEIYITKLVGGGNIFIYGPFSLQGCIYVVLAFLLSIIVFFLVLNNASSIIGADMENINKYIINDHFRMILLIELCVFSFLGMFSGYLSSKKYLKNN